MTDPIQIDIWSDLVCPFCFLGKKHLEAAIAQTDYDVNVTWHSFQLDRNAPALIEDHFAAFAEKYSVAVEEAKAQHDRLTEAGNEVGIGFRWDILKRGNTFDGHRVVHLAARQGLADQCVERLMAGYFEQGEPIGDGDALIRMAGEIGLDEAEVGEMLASDELGYEVRADEATAKQLDITAVPYFVLDRKYAVSGAQPVDIFVQALNYAVEHAGEPVTAREGGACGGGCGHCGCG